MALEFQKRIICNKEKFSNIDEAIIVSLKETFDIIENSTPIKIQNSAIET